MGVFNFHVGELGPPSFLFLQGFCGGRTITRMNTYWKEGGEGCPDMDHPGSRPRGSQYLL